MHWMNEIGVVIALTSLLSWVEWPSEVERVGCSEGHPLSLKFF